MQLGSIQTCRTRLLATTVALALLPGIAVVVAAQPAHAAGIVTVGVVGQGAVTGDGIDCTHSGGPDCSQYYADNSYQECDPELRPPCWTVTEPPEVVMTAGPDTNGFAFSGWTGCSLVSGRECRLLVEDDRTLTATYRDVQAPTVGTPSPASGVRRGTIPLSVTASDNAAVARVDFRVRGTLVLTDTTAPFQGSFDSTAVSDGSAVIQATAYDPSGNSSSAVSTVTIDNTAPALSVTSPGAGSVHRPGQVSFSFLAADATSSTTQECSVVPHGAAAAFGACSDASSHEQSLGTGRWAFTVRSTDLAGNTATASRTVWVDGIRPTVSDVRPRADSRTDDRTPLVKAVVRDEVVAGVQGTLTPADVRLEVDGRSRRFSLTGSRLSWQASRMALGRHTVRVVVTDQAGNRTTRSWSFRVVR